MKLFLQLIVTFLLIGVAVGYTFAELNQFNNAVAVAFTR